MKVIPYSGRDGAYKLFQNECEGSLYSQLIIINASNVAIHEKFILEQLENYDYYFGGDQTGEGMQILMKVSSKSMKSMLLLKKNLDEESSVKYKAVVIPGQGNVQKTNFGQILGYEVV